MIKKLQVLLSLCAIGGFGYLSYIAYSKAKKNAEKERELRRIAHDEYENECAKFKKMKENFKKNFTDLKISTVTLSNEKIENKDDRSFVYDKLTGIRNDIIMCNMTNYLTGEYDELVDNFASMYTALKQLDKPALEAKIHHMKKLDENIRIDMHKRQEARKEELKHQRELEIIEEKRKSEVEIYKAKMNVEKAKFDSMCKALQNSDKNVQSTFNIKTTISED